MSNKVEREWTAEELYGLLIPHDTRIGVPSRELATFLAQCTRLWAECERIEQETEGGWGVDDFAGELQDVRRLLDAMRDGGRDE